MVTNLSYKREIHFDENGIVYRDETTYTVSRLWNDNVGGAIINPRNHHKKLYNNKRLSETGMSDADLLKTYKLSEYIVKNTNIIGRLKGHAYGTSKHLAEILGVSEKTTREYLSRVTKINVLANINITVGHATLSCYAFNPLYVNSCKYVPLIIYKAFREDIDKVLPDWLRVKYEEELEARKLDGN